MGMAEAPEPGQPGGPTASTGLACGDQGASWRIHNFDQRSPVVEVAHPVLPRPLRFEQRGAGSPEFVPGTCSVAWPVAERMAWHLCRHPKLVCGRSIVELGAGIGIVGGVAAALGAAPAVLTDCQVALPILERNRSLLSEDGVLVDIARVEWGVPEDHVAVLDRERCRDGFDVVLACDVIVGGFDTDKLFESCIALLARRDNAVVLIGFEFREEWETIGTFLDWASTAGLEVSYEPLLDKEGFVKEDDSDDDEAMLLYTLRRPADLTKPP